MGFVLYVKYLPEGTAASPRIPVRLTERVTPARSNCDADPLSANNPHDRPVHGHIMDAGAGISAVVGDLRPVGELSHAPAGIGEVRAELAMAGSERTDRMRGLHRCIVNKW